MDEESSCLNQVTLTPCGTGVIDMEWLLILAVLVAIWLAVQIVKGRI